MLFFLGLSCFAAISISISLTRPVFYETSEAPEIAARQWDTAQKKWNDDNNNMQKALADRVARITALQTNATLDVTPEDARDSHSDNLGIFVVVFFRLPTYATDDDHGDTPGGSSQYPGDPTSRVDDNVSSNPPVDSRDTS